MRSKELFAHSDFLYSYLTGKQIAELHLACQKHFVDYVRDPKNKIRVCGNGYIAEKQRHFLEAEIFHFSPRHDIIVVFRAEFGRKTFKGFGKIPITPFWVIHTFSGDGGRVYLHGLTGLKGFAAYGGHFFDRFSERSYDNDLSRIRALALFTAITARRDIYREGDSHRVFFEAEDGVAVGDLIVRENGEEGTFFNTFLTREMHLADMVRRKPVLIKLDEPPINSQRQVNNAG